LAAHPPFVDRKQPFSFLWSLVRNNGAFAAPFSDFPTHPDSTLRPFFFPFFKRAIALSLFPHIRKRGRKLVLFFLQKANLHHSFLFSLASFIQGALLLPDFVFTYDNLIQSRTPFPLPTTIDVPPADPFKPNNRNSYGRLLSFFFGQFFFFVRIACCHRILLVRGLRWNSATPSLFFLPSLTWRKRSHPGASFSFLSIALCSL